MNFRSYNETLLKALWNYIKYCIQGLINFYRFSSYVAWKYLVKSLTSFDLWFQFSGKLLEPYKNGIQWSNAFTVHLHVNWQIPVGLISLRFTNFLSILKPVFPSVCSWMYFQIMSVLFPLLKILHGFFFIPIVKF